jgi:hypothetical protein
MTESPADMHPDRDLLPFYLNQTLSTAIRREVEAHLIRCPECREALAEWARIAQGVEQAAGQNVASLNATPPPLSPLVRLSLQPRPSLRQAAHSAWNLVWGQRVIFERSVSFPALGILVVVGILISLEVQTSTRAGSPLLFLGWVPIPFSEWGAIPLFTLIPIVAALLTALLYAIEDDEAFEVIASLPTPLATLVFARLTLALGSLTILALLGSVLVAILGGGGLFQLVATWLAPMLLLSALTTLLSIVWRPRLAAGLALVIWGALVILMVRELSGSPAYGISVTPLLQPEWKLVAGQLLVAGLLFWSSWLWLSLSAHAPLRRD